MPQPPSRWSSPRFWLRGLVLSAVTAVGAVLLTVATLTWFSSPPAEGQQLAYGAVIAMAQQHQLTDATEFTHDHRVVGHLCPTAPAPCAGASRAFWTITPIAGPAALALHRSFPQLQIDDQGSRAWLVPLADYALVAIIFLAWLAVTVCFWGLMIALIRRPRAPATS